MDLTLGMFYLLSDALIKNMMDKVMMDRDDEGLVLRLENYVWWFNEICDILDFLCTSWF